MKVTGRIGWECRPGFGKQFAILKSSRSFGAGKYEKSRRIIAEQEKIDKRDRLSLIPNAAAVALMGNGFAATSIDTVADVLGSTTGKIYYHFKSKTGVFLAIHQDSMTQYVARSSGPRLAAGTPEERLRGVLRALALQIMTRFAFSRFAVQGVELHMFRSTTPAQRKTLRSVIEMRDKGE